MVKYFLRASFIFSICLNFYLLSTSHETIVSDDLDQAIYEEVNDKISVAQSALKTKASKKNNFHKQNMKIIENELLPEKTHSAKHDNLESTDESNTTERFHEDYERARGKWERDVSEFIERNLGLPMESVDAYLELQKQREKEVSEYMSPKLDSANGEAYLFTLEDNISIGKINEKYLTQLRANMGTEAYEKFIKYRQSYNREMIKSGDSPYFIEF